MLNGLFALDILADILLVCNSGITYLFNLLLLSNKLFSAANDPTYFHEGISFFLLQLKFAILQ